MRLRSAALLLALAIVPARAEPGRCDRGSFRVLLDVGHSPSSPGATSARGRSEYGFNLRLSAAIEEGLKARGYRETTRLLASGGTERLSGRAAELRAAEPDLLLSVHHDSVQRRYLEPWTFEGKPQLFSDRFAGWSLFTSGASPRAAESLRFARHLADRLLARGWPFTRHHAEPIPGEGRPWAAPARGVHRFDALAVLKGSTAPAVLFEAGIIVNRMEEAELERPERQAAIAQAVGEAVDLFCAEEGGRRR